MILMGYKESRSSLKGLFYVSYDMGRGGLMDFLRMVPGGLVTASVRALNKTILGGKTDAAAILREKYNIRAGEVKEALRARKAHKGSLEAWLTARGPAGVPIIRFSGLPKLKAGAGTSTYRTRGGGYGPKIGASVLIRRDRGRAKIPGAFVARMPQRGTVGIYMRSGKAGFGGRKEAFRQVYGPSIVKLLTSEQFESDFRVLLHDRLDKNMQHEADFVLKQMGVR